MTPPDSEQTRRPGSGAPTPPPGTLPPAPGGAGTGAAFESTGSGTARSRSARTGGYARGTVTGVRRRLATTPARVRLLTSLCVVAIAGLFGSAVFTVHQANEGLKVLNDAGQRARATTELYLALADMDAQVADVLLMGTEHDPGWNRDDALERYESSRERANEVLLDAASLTEDCTVSLTEDCAVEKHNTMEKHNVRAVLDGMGSYEQLATEAQVLNGEAQPPPGEVDEAALEAYLKATRLMHTELLPKAFNLGLDSSATVRANHEEKQSSVALGLVGVGTVGVVTVAALIILQLYLRRRFRRRINAPLLAATAVAAVLTVGVVLTVVNSGGHQREAKEEGMDAEMRLARAGAVTTDMQAGQSRYLLIQAGAGTTDMQEGESRYLLDNYQQVYLEQAQRVLFRPASNLEAYYEAVGEAADAYPKPPGPGGAGDEDPGTLGYLGKDAQDALLPGQQEMFADVLESYNALQAEDRALRSEAESHDLGAAIDTRMGVVNFDDGAFRNFEVALDGLIGMHKEVFEVGIKDGRAVLSPWIWLLPSGAALLMALVVFGVGPRLAEYR